MSELLQPTKVSDMQNVLNRFKLNQPARQKYIDYYDGRHRLNFATEKFKTTFGETLKVMRDNLCPIVVEAPADRMEVINFAGNEADTQTSEFAWQIWQRERMELVSNQLHTETIKTGAGYVIVWPDTTGNAKFYVQDSRNCVVVKDPDTLEVRYAGKLWKDEDMKLRLNLYYPDRIDRFTTRNKYEAGASDLKESLFVSVDTIPNPFGIVPMFEFEALPILENAIPIQDALNKTICDKLVAMEFAAFPQRWATGIEIPEDGSEPFKAGPGRLWVSDSIGEKESKFGQFEAANLEMFLKVADSYRLEMARISGTPLHFFSINTSDAISGEALKTLESRFTKRVKRLCLSFGVVWAAAMRFALEVEGFGVSANLTAQWAEAEQRSEKEFLETLGLKRDTLDVPVDVLREEFGYTEEDIAAFNKVNELQFDEPTTPKPPIGDTKTEG